MPNPQYQLNETNWELFYSETKYRATQGEVAIPIEPWKLGLLADSELLAVACQSKGAKDNWIYAGFMTLGFSTGLTVGGVADAESGTSRRLKLNQIQIFPVQKFAAEYSIAFSVPYWLPDITITVWQYIGAVVYPEITLLNEINAKIP